MVSSVDAVAVCVKELIIYAVFTAFGFFPSFIHLAVYTADVGRAYKMFPSVFRKAYWLAIAATVTTFHSITLASYHSSYD